MKHNALLTTTTLVAYANEASAGTEINTPLGRIVFGSPFRTQDKMKDGQKVLDANGQPVKVITFGVAFPKPEFEAMVWPTLAAEASKLFGPQPPQNFSYKYKDGDSAQVPYNNGKPGRPYNTREGYPGHYVLTVSTELSTVSVMKFFNGAYHQVGADGIKTGDYVQMTINVKAHAGQTPGLYINPVMVLLCYEGDPISNGFEADPTQKFGAAPQMAPMPAGARPVGAGAPAMGAPGGMPGQPAPMAQPQYAPQPGNGYAGAAPAMSQPMMANAGTAVPGANGMPMQGSPAPGGMPAVGQPQMQPNANMGGQPNAGYAQPVPGSMPPPATDFIPGTAAMPGQAAPGGMPGMPQR